MSIDMVSSIELKRKCALDEAVRRHPIILKRWREFFRNIEKFYASRDVVFVTVYKEELSFIRAEFKRIMGKME